MLRHLLAFVVLGVFVVGVSVGAQDPDTEKKLKPKSSVEEKDNAVLDQERLARQFRDFESSLLQLAQRLERSNKPEDRERAAILKEAIKKAGEESIDTKFETLVALLRSSKSLNLTEVKEAMDRSKLLADDIR